MAYALSIIKPGNVKKLEHKFNTGVYFSLTDNSKDNLKSFPQSVVKTQVKMIYSLRINKCNIKISAYFKNFRHNILCKSKH